MSTSDDQIQLPLVVAQREVRGDENRKTLQSNGGLEEYTNASAGRGTTASDPGLLAGARREVGGDGNRRTLPK